MVIPSRNSKVAPTILGTFAGWAGGRCDVAAAAFAASGVSEMFFDTADLPYN